MLLRQAGAAILVGALLAAMLPAQAAEPMARLGDEPLVAWLKSDGSSGLSTLSDYMAIVGTDATQSCSGVAPVQNNCTLKDVTTYPFGGSWSVGFVLPNLGIVPAGALVGSTVVNLTGSKSVVRCCWTVIDQPVSIVFGCNWEFVNVLGVNVGDVNCGDLAPRTAQPAGELTAVFHIGALDGRLPYYGVPTNNSLEAGLGSWGGLLVAR